MIRNMLVGLVLLALLVACGGSATPPTATPAPSDGEPLPVSPATTLTVMTHDSFAVTPEVLAKFEQQHNDLFAGNRLPAGEVFGAIERTAPELQVHALKPGELFFYVR